jgi:asparagine synthase (glutamine-hydrolysing)
MCGIAAIYNYNTSHEVDRGELRTMRDRMRRRGPDGAGEWYGAAGRLGLAHRRLSIIDLSERGAQPMLSADGRFAITFNGEIYNYRALREALLRDGVSFHSESDTEVLLELYRRRGTDMLPLLRGMFAFALWDAERSSLLLARDPYGIKPLYYCDEGGELRVASQVKALLAGGRVSPALDEGSVAAFLMMGSVPEPRTIHAHIRALPAGHFLSVVDGRLTAPVEYHSVTAVWREAAVHAPGRDAGDADGAFAAMATLLRDSVAHHMVADVPVGAFLSAGIDSGSLVGLARDTGVADMRTVTLAFGEFRGRHDDEAPLAEEVAAHFGTRHETRLLGRSEFDASLDDILDVMDQPSIDGINSYFVSLVTAESGLKVALSGLGGDELLGGYNTFDDVPRWVRRFGPFARMPLVGRLFRIVASDITRQIGRSPKAAGALLYGGSFPGAWYLRRGLFMPWELPALLGRERAEEGLRSFSIRDCARAGMTPDPSDAFARVAALEATLYMRNQLLRDTDWASMAHSLEVRVPLVDAALLHAAAPLALAYAPTHRKRLLALAPSRPIPAHIMARRKTGFQVPVTAWLEENPRIDDWRAVPSLARPGVPWERRWGYTVLQRWTGMGHG